MNCIQSRINGKERISLTFSSGSILHNNSYIFHCFLRRFCKEGQHQRILLPLDKLPSSKTSIFPLNLLPYSSIEAYPSWSPHTCPKKHNSLNSTSNISELWDRISSTKDQLANIFLPRDNSLSSKTDTLLWTKWDIQAEWWLHISDLLQPWILGNTAHISMCLDCKVGINSQVERKFLEGWIYIPKNISSIWFPQTNCRKDPFSEEP